ncbi:class I SAM-dependent methyltransferase [Kribbella catacumbae]|uniref:class I SAM-dependent methyltransferase n=1 Tax=Kribbella catacumbae TaxID=460086 RepID=UPI00035D51CD|nr:methyltransferase domain-containing protein [Kribbella catacumbae]
MSGCCEPDDCGAVFSERFARRVARRYRRQGLSPAAEQIVQFVAGQGVRGATVLEIGGGVGEIQLELLRLGAARVTNLELSANYEEEAERLIKQAGVGDRVTRRLLDIAEAPGEVEPADVVVLHRVVCCNPDYERLLSAAGSHARRMLVFSHPGDDVLARTAIWFETPSAG